MRTEWKLFLVLALVVWVTNAVAKNGAGQKSSTTTTTTTQTTTITGPEHNIEGCVAKEGGDYFLVPQRGAPFKLQASANQDLAAEEGHRVMVSGKELSPSAAGSQTIGAPGETGGDLHRLANRGLAVDRVRSIAQSCPVNWNPR
jgi:hypothetical protein